MILVADSGSTKCDWVIIDNTGKRIVTYATEGVNPLILSQSDIMNTINKSSEIVYLKSLVSEIYFYGAGCGTEKANNKIKTCLLSVFKNAELIDIHEDIIAAVHATTKQPGVIAILGTGSNCCYFDGIEVIQKVPSLGYILADDASGNYFGKELLKSFYLHQMPKDIEVDFKNTFDSDLNILFQKLYNSQYPNRYLASYAGFLFKHIQHPFIKKILDKGIRLFIENYLMLYAKELANAPVHFVGSIAYYSQDTINHQLHEKGFHAKSFIKKPIDKLITAIISNTTSTALKKIS
ncbi:N-acetylglucosamine kinase [Aquimarina sp. AU474]|uniref:N-acetylglucosamine kinase n=1 Tax=Aquimarina sp. AU474 TaxID=2108529 RepID=UPI000D68AFCD|nr:N-acetylglucosamine kinase [Aquimarina sp. AU474]